MSDVVVTEFITVDGVIEDPGGAERETFAAGGWAFRSSRGDEGDRFKLEELRAAGAQLLGRRTYEGFARAWPTITDSVGFAERMNSMPKYVVSTTLQEAAWANSTIIREDVPGAVRRLKSEVEGDILVAGSATLVAALAAADLVDEYRLMVFPVVLGTGKRLFPDGIGPYPLRLTGARRADDCQILVYRRERAEGGTPG